MDTLNPKYEVTQHSPAQKVGLAQPTAKAQTKPKTKVTNKPQRIQYVTLNQPSPPATLVPNITCKLNNIKIYPTIETSYIKPTKYQVTSSKQTPTQESQSENLIT